MPVQIVYATTDHEAIVEIPERRVIVHRRDQRWNELAPRVTFLASSELTAFIDMLAGARDELAKAEAGPSPRGNRGAAK